MAKLRWRGMRDFHSAERRPFYADGLPTGAASQAADGDGEVADAAISQQAQPQERETDAWEAHQQQRQAAALGARRLRQTAGFVREHGPLALVTVMSAGEATLMHVPHPAVEALR